MDSTKETKEMTTSSEIYLFKSIQSHCNEILSLNTECETKLPKLLSQRLPRFMRRRASSHNPKRIPKSVRQSVVNKINESLERQKKPKNPKNKKNRKKYVNRKRQELSLKRRNERKERSVLHVWFAKRFRMKMYWNCLAPEKNCTKNERLLYHNSKDDFVFYYLSFQKCIQIDFSKSGPQELIGFLSKFTNSEIGCTFGAKIYESGEREGTGILYNYNSYPFEPLVSVNFLWNKSYSKLWLWIHISVYDNVLKELTDRSQEYSNGFELKARTHRLERFRMVGPNSLKLLSMCLKCDFKESLNLDEIHSDSIHYFKFSDNNISLIKSNETNLFEDNEESVTKQKSSNNNFDFILIIKNKTFKNRFTVDLIVSTDSAKILWNKLTVNRGHRVGGMEDLKSIALNTSSLLFPNFGFIDVKENMDTIEKLKTLLNIGNIENPFHVIRNDSIISKLTRELNSIAINQVLDSFEGKNNALINVEVVCVRRGIPQQFDYICIPTENELKTVFKQTIDGNIIEEPMDCETEVIDNELNREIIGLIEFGKYSLETSRGKGLGVITISGLKELIKCNENIGSNNNKNYKNNRIFASFKSLKSCLYRIVTLRVIDSLFSA